MKLTYRTKNWIKQIKALTYARANIYRVSRGECARFQYMHVQAYNNETLWFRFFIQKAITVFLLALSESAGTKRNTSIDVLLGHISTFLCFTSNFSIIQFRYDSILPSMTAFCKCSLQFRFTDQTFVYARLTSRGHGRHMLWISLASRTN